MRKVKKALPVFIVALSLIFSFDLLRKEAAAENSTVQKQEINGNSITTGSAITTGGAVNVPTPGGITTEPAITTPGTIEDESRKNPNVEIFDEFDVKGISYQVAEIKSGKIYVEVTGIINDRATTVYIPKKVKYKGEEMIVNSIGEDCFSYMERLRKVVIAADIKYIEKDVFKDAAKLGRLIIKSNFLSKVGKNAFKGVGNKLVIEVPKKKLKTYKKLFVNKGVKVKAIRAIKK